MNWCFFGWETEVYFCHLFAPFYSRGALKHIVHWITFCVQPFEKNNLVFSCDFISNYSFQQSCHVENNDFWFCSLVLSNSLLASLDQLKIRNKLDSGQFNSTNSGSDIFDSADAYPFMGIILAKSESLFKISSRNLQITQTLRGSRKNLIFWKVMRKISKEMWKMKKTWMMTTIRRIIQNQTETLSACYPLPVRRKCDWIRF